MIKLNIEGDGEEIVALIQALQGGGVGIAPVETAPLLSAVDTAPDPAADVASEPAYTEEQVQKGWSVFSDLVNKWAVNFGPDGDPSAQPDRLALLEISLRHFNAMLSFIHQSGGVTRAVRSIGPDHWTKDFCRKIAENIVSVSSATGVSGFSEMLEYDQDYYATLAQTRAQTHNGER